MSKKKLHYLWSLKDNGIIDHAMVSFSVTSKEMNETPYALFGGYNSSQIVNGADGLKTFKNFPNWLGTWVGTFSATRAGVHGARYRTRRRHSQPAFWTTRYSVDLQEMTLPL